MACAVICLLNQWSYFIKLSLNFFGFLKLILNIKSKLLMRLKRRILLLTQSILKQIVTLLMFLWFICLQKGVRNSIITICDVRYKANVTFWRCLLNWYWKFCLIFFLVILTKRYTSWVIIFFLKLYNRTVMPLRKNFHFFIRLIVQ